LDVHATSCTAAVVNAQGKRLGSHVIATSGAALVEFLKAQAGTIHLCIEEGTQSAWLAEILSPHVEQMVVTQLAESRGQKNDERDAESHRHAETRWLESCPGIGQVRAAQIAAVVVTPERFRRRRQFWSYCGLGIVMRSSSDWVQTAQGKWTRAQVKQTRGLNYNHNHMLKSVFKGAATSVLQIQSSDAPQD